MLLSQKTAIITGTNRGIGRSMLEVFAQEGCQRIFACARQASDDFSKSLDTLSHKYDVPITPIYFDLLDEGQIKAAVKEIAEETKNIDILINNAGAAHGALFQMSPVKDMRRLFDINFFSQIQLSQAIARYMVKNKKGAIVNVLSTAGLIGDAGTMTYGGSKAALAFATKTMATELGRFQIRVNGVAPSVTMTDMYDQMDEKARDQLVARSALGRPAQPEEVARVAAFLASDYASYVSGQVLRVDGGMTT